jgi:hypothetical protein
MSQDKGQSSKHSLYESCLNVFIGYIVAIGAQLIILPLYDIHIPIHQNLTMALLFTITSLIRSYILRRWFNKLSVQK